MSGCSGRGEAIGHVGEILQGALRLNGGIEPFLVTLPAPFLRSEATVASRAEWRVSPGWKTKALRAAQLACEDWGIREALQVDVRSEIPVAGGFGSSTADCVATIRAVASWADLTCSNEEIARLAQRAETACDSTMFGLEPLAFLPRRGEVLARFGAAWPAFDFTIADLGGAPVDTLACETPTYTGEELDEFAALLEDLAKAFRSADAFLLGRIASRSAVIQQRYRPHLNWRSTVESAVSSGAYGVAIAHTGNVAAVLQPVELAAKGVNHHHADLVGRRR